MRPPSAPWLFFCHPRPLISTRPMYSPTPEDWAKVRKCVFTCVRFQGVPLEDADGLTDTILLEVVKWNIKSPCASLAELTARALHVARQRVVDYWRQRSRNPGSVDADDSEVEDDDQDTPTTSSIRSEEKELIHKALRNVLARNREPYVSGGKYLNLYDRALVRFHIFRSYGSLRKCGRRLKQDFARFGRRCDIAGKHETYACARMKDITKRLIIEIARLRGR